MIRIGIIGCGGIATGRHIPTFKQFETVKITHVYDINAEVAKSASEQFDIPHVSESAEALIDAVDAVVITTPNKFHAPLSVLALEKNKHVFCEKPMAKTSEECQQMIEAEKNSKGILHIGYHYRFMKEAIACKTLIEAGRIGQPLVIRVQAMRRRKVPGWGVFTNKDLQGGGALIDYGCHLLDLATWLSGSLKPIEVSASTYNVLSKQHAPVNEWGAFDPESFEVDDHVSAFIRFENNISMLFETSWAANVESDCEHISISGDLGGIDVFNMRLNEASNGMMSTTQIDYVQTDKTFEYLQAENFIGAIQGVSHLKVQPQEAKYVSQMIEAIYESASTNQAIKIGE